jgi:hypothetical protein
MGHILAQIERKKNRKRELKTADSLVLANSKKNCVKK